MIKNFRKVLVHLVDLMTRKKVVSASANVTDVLTRFTLSSLKNYQLQLNLREDGCRLSIPLRSNSKSHSFDLDEFNQFLT
jgi:hypothetical protein